MPSLVLENIGKYKLIREIGRGGMGVVYHAEDSSLSRQVALKVLYPSLLTDPAFVDQFRKEAQAIAALESPFVVRINSLNEFDGDQVAIDMELMAHGSVPTQFDSPLAGARLAHEVLSGLSTCHELGLVHRDIKPNNLLVSETGAIKIADFGLATAYSCHLEKTVSQHTSSGFFMGTPRYAPPEAWDGSDASPLWDIYSLGVVLYEGVTRHIIYDGTNPLTIAKQIATTRPQPVRELMPELSEEFGTLIDSMIAHDPAQRPQSADEAFETLSRTAELCAIDVNDRRTVRVKRPRFFTARRTAKGHLSRSAKYAIGFTTVIVALGLAAVSSSLYDWTGLRSVDPKPPAQASLNTTEPDSTASAAVAPAGDGNAGSQPSAVYTGYDLDGGAGYEYAWRTNLAQDGRTGDVQICWDSGAGYATLERNTPSTYSVSGQWAAFRDPAGRRLQIGTMEGTLKRDAPGDTLFASLVWVDERSREQTRHVMTLERSSKLMTAADFWAHVESRPHVQSLVYNELLPRDIGWAAAYESHFGESNGQRVKAPIVAGDWRPTLDGNLEDKVWQTRFYDRVGRIGELPLVETSGQAGCSARLVEQSLFVAIRLNAAPSSDMRLQVALAPLVSGATSEWPTFHASWTEDGRVETHFLIGQREAPWDSEWQMAASRSQDGMWQAELELPLANIFEGRELQDLPVVRMNASVSAPDNNGAMRRLGFVGSPETGQAIHGAVIRFDSTYDIN